MGRQGYRIKKEYWEGYPFESFVDACEGEQCFELDGIDYIILCGKKGWFVSLLDDYVNDRAPTVVCGYARTPEKLVNERSFGGKSIKERYYDVKPFEYEIAID